MIKTTTVSLTLFLLPLLVFADGFGYPGGITLGVTTPAGSNGAPANFALGVDANGHVTTNTATGGGGSGSYAGSFTGNGAGLTNLVYGPSPMTNYVDTQGTIWYSNQSDHVAVGITTNGASLSTLYQLPATNTFVNFAFPREVYAAQSSVWLFGPSNAYSGAGSIYQHASLDIYNITNVAVTVYTTGFNAAGNVTATNAVIPIGGYLSCAFWVTYTNGAATYNFVNAGTPTGTNTGTFIGTFVGNGTGLTNNNAAISSLSPASMVNSNQAAAIATAAEGDEVLVNTNFLSGIFYSNSYGGIIAVSAGATLTGAAVVGVAQLSLWVPGSVTNNVSMATLLTSLASTDTVAFPTTYVPAGSLWILTNTSTGAGNKSAPANGQILAP